MFVLSTAIWSRAAFTNARVTMPNVSDVVDRIQICPAFVVVEILPPSLHDVQRLSISDAQRRTDVLATYIENLIGTQARGSGSTVRGFRESD